MMQHTFVAWSCWRDHPHRYGSWGIWNITQVSSKRLVRWKQSMVGFSYMLSQENNLVLRRVATCWFSLVSSFEGCSRRYVTSSVLASLMSILSSNAKSALSICSDSIASSYNPSRQFINIQRIWTDQLRLYNHIFWFLLEKPRNRLAHGNGKSRRCGPPSAVPLLFQHPAHPTRPQVLEIENILNTVVLFHNISKVYARSEHTRFFWILLWR